MLVFALVMMVLSGAALAQIIEDPEQVNIFRVNAFIINRHSNP